MSSASDVVIRVENLGKRYRLQQASTARYHKFSDALVHTAKTAVGKLKWGKRKAESLSGKAQESFPLSTFSSPLSSKDSFWALKDLSFEVKEGEILGVIGRNGAGKSTLLKVLSRITEPTEGRVTLRGRLAALLEVGTGFHPELTGRENIYLNGAILGMRREEIRAQFDEIVQFAEVEAFLDMPVKRYSSGMYVRLAFSVAAHLHPEILIVDEVLAVGDAAFQQKCLGKVGSAARGGRTVLFVSHNMNVLAQLCQKALVLESGRLIFQGEMREGIGHYLGKARTSPKMTAIGPTQHSADWGGSEKIRLEAVELLQASFASFTVRWKQPIHVRLHLQVLQRSQNVYFGLALSSAHGSEVLGSHHNDSGLPLWDLQPGRHQVDIQLQNPLRAGVYTLAFGASTALGGGAIFRVANAVTLEVLDLAEDDSPYPQYEGGPINGEARWSLATVA